MFWREEKNSLLLHEGTCYKSYVFTKFSSPDGVICTVRFRKEIEFEKVQRELAPPHVNTK